MKKIWDWLRFIFLIILTILISGCTEAKATKEMPTAVVSSKALSTELSIDTTPTNEYSKATATVLVPAKLPTPTPSPSLLLTPNVKSLSPIEAQSSMLELLNDNGSCRLPCILGISPGMTSQARWEFLAPFDPGGCNDDFCVRSSNDEPYPILGFSYKRGDNLVYGDVTPYESSGTIDRLALITDSTTEAGEKIFGDKYYTELFAYYLLGNLLRNYGLPSEVLIGTWGHDPFLKAPYEPFSVVVIYEQGIMAEYISPNEPVGDAFRGCPTQGILTLRAWDPASQIPLETIATMGATIGISGNALDYFRPIEEATGKTLEEFYDMFKDAQGEVCLETPKELWFTP